MRTSFNHSFAFLCVLTVCKITFVKVPNKFPTLDLQFKKWHCYKFSNLVFFLPKTPSILFFQKQGYFYSYVNRIKISNLILQFRFSLKIFKIRELPVASPPVYQSLIYSIDRRPLRIFSNKEPYHLMTWTFLNAKCY